MCTRNPMMNISAEITLMAITDLCVTIVVRDSSTKVNSVSTGTQFILKRKDYACNKCQERAFTSIGCLKCTLAICGKEAKEQCGICGKMYSTKETLFTHINNVHKDGVTRQCPFCDEKVYTSEGGYYKHMRVKHNISRNTIKLSDYMKAQASGEKNSEEDENTQNKDSESDKKRNKKPSKKNKKDKVIKSENTENGTNTQNGRKKKSIGSEDTDDIQPKRKKRQSETDDVGKKKNIGSEDTDDMQSRRKKRKSETDDVGKKKNIGSEDTDDMHSRCKRRKSDTDDVDKKSKNTEDDK